MPVQRHVYAVRLEGAAEELPPAGLPRKQRVRAALSTQQMVQVEELTRAEASSMSGVAGSGHVPYDLGHRWRGPFSVWPPLPAPALTMSAYLI